MKISLPDPRLGAVAIVGLAMIPVIWVSWHSGEGDVAVAVGRDAVKPAPEISPVVPADYSEFPLVMGGGTADTLILIENVLDDRFSRQRENILRGLSVFEDEIRVLEIPVVSDFESRAVAEALFTAYLADEGVYRRLVHRLAIGEIEPEPDLLYKEAALRAGASKFAAVQREASDKIASLVASSEELSRSHSAGAAGCTLVFPSANSLRKNNLSVEEVVRVTELELGVRHPGEIPSYAPLQEEVHAPRLVLRVSRFDLGKVDPGDEVAIRVPVSNGGSDPLMIESIRCPQGVLISSLPHESIDPGEEGVVGLRIVAPHSQGNFKASIDIVSNDLLNTQSVEIVASVDAAPAPVATMPARP